MRDGTPPLPDALLEESAEDLYEHAPCGYLSLLPDGLIGKINTTMADWIGYSKDELVGRVRFIDLLTVGGRIYYETHFQPLLRMQGRVREIAFDLRRREGDRLSVLVNASERSHAELGAITRITVFDATDRRRYERELLAARQQAEEAAEAKSDLITTISHDVRSPLNAITMALHLLEGTATPEQIRYLRVLQSSTAHATALVNNLLDLSRLESGRSPLREDVVSVRSLVDAVTETAHAGALRKPDIDVSARIGSTVPDEVIADRPKIEQVLSNLLTNAIKFTERGFVSLIVGARDVSPTDVTLEMVVSDSGIGIPADRLPHIFDEYTQASDDIRTKYGGSGLGLAICRKILRLYGSQLTVTSTVGQGTTFSFPLVLKRANPPPA